MAAAESKAAELSARPQHHARGRRAGLRHGRVRGRDDLALLDRAPRNASVIAESPMELAKMGQKAFDELLDVPGFSKKLLAGLARRLRQEDAKTR